MFCNSSLCPALAGLLRTGFNVEWKVFGEKKTPSNFIPEYVAGVIYIVNFNLIPDRKMAAPTEETQHTLLL